MLKQQKFDYLLNNAILTIDTVRQIAIHCFDDGYYNACKSLEEVVELCDKLFIFVDNVRQCCSLDKSPDLNNLQ